MAADRPAPSWSWMAAAAAVHMRTASQEASRASTCDRGAFARSGSGSETAEASQSAFPPLHTSIVSVVWAASFAHTPYLFRLKM